MIIFKLIRESFVFAFTALRVNKLRTFLSLLGISIGIFTIITVFTVVDSLENNIRGSVEKLGDDVLYVQKWPWVIDSNFPWWKFFQRPVPSYKDFDGLTKRMENVTGIAYVLDVSSRTLKYGNNSVENVSVSAVTHDFNKVRNLEFEDGRYFSAMESQSGKNYTVIGFSVAESLFQGADPIGKHIKTLGRKLLIIGVLKKEGDDILGSSSDNSIFIPMNFARMIIDVRSDNYDPFIMVKGSGNVPFAELENELKGAMRSVRKISPKNDDNFSINQSSLLAKPMESLFGVLNIAGWIIGGFSILVGGFGIANIMFVSVKERTSEIGIQKSLGAKNYFILLQFLVEAIILCLLGGLIGLALVYLITLAASAFDFNIALSLKNIFTGLFVSAIIGTISGFWPAWTASRLDPVEAIRSK